MDNTDLEGLDLVKELLDDGDITNAQEVVSNLIATGESEIAWDGPSSFSSSDSGKGDVIAVLITLGIVGAISFFGIRAGMREEKRVREEAEKRRQKLAMERTKAQDAASRGATVLQNSDGTYWIIENDASKARMDNNKSTEEIADIEGNAKLAREEAERDFGLKSVDGQ